MSQAGIVNTGNNGGGSSMLTLTAQSGGPVSPDVSGNINVLGASTISTSGNPGAHSITITNTPTVFPMVVAKIGATVTNATGDNTTVGPVIYDTVISQVGTGYSGSTGIFTVPTTGYYFITATLSLDGITNAHTSGTLLITDAIGLKTILAFNPATAADASGIFTSTLTGFYRLTASQMIWISIQVGGGAKVVNLVGEDFGEFSTLGIYQVA